MRTIGHIESLWRYPVKSRRGEELREAFPETGGIFAHRIYAFQYSGAPAHFLYLTARQQPEMLLYRATYHTRHDGGKGRVFVDTPQGDRFRIEDKDLITLFSHGVREGESVTLLSSDKAMTDCHPVSLLSVQTVRQLGEELRCNVDKLRFRANLYLSLNDDLGFAEDQFVGRKLLIGSAAVIKVIERDERCKIITLDPASAKADPNIMRRVSRVHERKVGIYGSVSVEGIIKTGDQVALAD